ncbi:MAG: S41 family peptidase [Bacteroidota bacterium]|nr:S41 family peptidase [Bacteroidota bacterium]MDP4236944.1 S41 family peptidase [Bacteroidota bacterium]
MKRFLLLGFFLFLSVNCHATEDQGKLSDAQVKHIGIYCKVWGFLKYYHPAVTDGNINWDSTFIRIYPSIRDAKSDLDFKKPLMDLYQSAERARDKNMHPTTSPRSDDEISIVQFGWLEDAPTLGDELSKALQKIRREFKPTNCHYIAPMTGASNPDFTMDKEFTEPRNDYPDEPLRALAASRFWNAINYFAPNKDLIGFPWDSALFRYVPAIVAARDTLSYQMNALLLYKSINDGHASTNAPWAGEYLGMAWLPLAVSDIEGKPVITGSFDYPTENSDSILSSLGIHRGDIIVKINGNDADSLRKSRLPYVPGSNDAGKMRNATLYLLRGKPGQNAILTLASPSGVREVTVPFSMHAVSDPWHTQDRSGVWKILPGNIGYVNMGILNVGQVPEMMKDLANTKGIVFDVRNYPHGSMYAIGEYLGKKKPFVYFTIPDVTNPGYLFKSDKNMMECGGEERYHGKIAILANEKTQSHAEFTIMSFQVVPGAKTFGSQTAGADGNISTIPLPGGVNTIFTGLGVFYPDGRRTQQVGIKIDYEVKPTIKGIREGKDEVLERAVRYINTGS